MKSAAQLAACCLLGLGLCFLTSCPLRGKSSAAKTPPAPAPPTTAAARAAAMPEAPLSTPQTEVQLPAPQAISPEALATAQQPVEVEPVEPPAPPKPARRAGPPAPPRVDTGQVELPPIAPPTVEEPRGRIQPIVPAEEARRLLDAIQKRKVEIAALVNRAKTRRLSENETTALERIQSFLTQTDEAAGRGDIRQADALCERALVLARELQNER